MLKDNLKTAIKNSGMIVKDIADKAKVNKRTIDKWVGVEETEPRINDLYEVCKALGITVEWAVKGEDGLNYVRDLIAKEGKLWKAPEKIREIVEALNSLDDKTLRTVKTMITALHDKYEEPVQPLFTKDPSPEYDSLVIDISRYNRKSKKIDNVQFMDWEMALIPFYGNVAAGRPISISYLPDEAIPFPKQRLKSKTEDYFAVRIQGTSMVNADIDDGDYVIIHRAEEPVDGKIMLVRYDNESTLKKIKIKTDKKGNESVYICWEDGSGEKILLNSSDYEIQGELYLNLGEWR